MNVTRTKMLELALIECNRDQKRDDQFVVIPAIIYDEIMEILNGLEDSDNDGLAFDLMTAASIAELKE